MSETLSETETAVREILVQAARAVSASSDRTPEENRIRFRIMVNTATAFLPADEHQTLLATQAVGHHLAMMDGMRDLASRPHTTAETVKARSVAIAQSRAFIQASREIRALQRASRAEAEAAAKVPDAAPPQAEETAMETPPDADTPDPEIAAKVAAIMNFTMPEALFQSPAAAQPPAIPAGSRAQRRAQMKQRGMFRKRG